MPRQGIDYAWHHSLNLDAFRTHGVTFVVRYLSNDLDEFLRANRHAPPSDAGNCHIIDQSQTPAEQA